MQYPLSSRLLNNTMNFLSNTCTINKMAVVCGLPSILITNWLILLYCIINLNSVYICIYELLLFKKKP